MRSRGRRLTILVASLGRHAGSGSIRKPETAHVTTHVRGRAIARTVALRDEQQARARGVRRLAGTGVLSAHGILGSATDVVATRARSSHAGRIASAADDWLFVAESASVAQEGRGGASSTIRLLRQRRRRAVMLRLARSTRRAPMRSNCGLVVDARGVGRARDRAARRIVVGGPTSARA